jgi:hypothetical protein
VIAVQAWNYKGMSFVPQLNFLEFMPEDEQLKWQMDRTYMPRRCCSTKLNRGELRDYHHQFPRRRHDALLRGGHGPDTVPARRRTGVKTPQMVFERRVDDVWSSWWSNPRKSRYGRPSSSPGRYVDWVAYKTPGEPVMNPPHRTERRFRQRDRAGRSHSEVFLESRQSTYGNTARMKTGGNGLDFGVKVTFLPQVTFARFTAQRQAEGADLAHIKPPHVNPSEKVIAMLTAETEETIVVTGRGEIRAETAPEGSAVP